MALVSLDEAKSYLRVDYAGEDSLIGSLLAASISLCVNVARLSNEQWEAINSGCQASDSGENPEITAAGNTLRTAILYALGYFFEHRENANHSNLTLTLRSLLFSIRKEGF